MRTRNQVFVSSTFLDLASERRAVTEALLALDCIPAGMELFPASDTDAWNWIKREIDDSDYYIVIIADRYGSRDKNDLSYTENEYDYAVEKGKPVLAFLNAAPDSVPSTYRDPDLDSRDKLKAFRGKVEKRKLCAYWATTDQLKAEVTTSYYHAVKDYPANGWARVGKDFDPKLNEKIARLGLVDLVLQRDDIHWPPAKTKFLSFGALQNLPTGALQK
jgi:hypothetical protein